MLSWHVMYLRDDGLLGGGHEGAPHVLLGDALVLVGLVLQTRQLYLLARQARQRVLQKQNIGQIKYTQFVI